MGPVGGRRAVEEDDERPGRHLGCRRGWNAAEGQPMLLVLRWESGIYPTSPVGTH